MQLGARHDDTGHRNDGSTRSATSLGKLHIVRRAIELAKWPEARVGKHRMLYRKLFV